MKWHFDNFAKVNGIALNSVKEGELVNVLTKIGTTSDDPRFYKLVSSTQSLFLSSISPILPSQIVKFLLVLHPSDSAELYINDFIERLKIKAKLDVQAGELVSLSKVADIERLNFEGITLEPEDRIIFCSKVGWKFLFYFKLGPEGIEDVDVMEQELGHLHRKLLFEDLYSQLASPDPKFDSDGWFPFIDLLGEDFNYLQKVYGVSPDFENDMSKFLDGFDSSKIDIIISKWWKNGLFSDKRLMIEAGVEAFLRGTDKDLICACNTLAPLIEGLVRQNLYEQKNQVKRVGTKEVETHLIGIVSQKVPDVDSLLLPQNFLRYWKDVLFKDFDMQNKQFSRHSLAHGVLDGTQFSRTRALQLILTLGQLYFYTT